MNSIAIIVGSHRENAQSLKIANVIEQKLSCHLGCSDVSVLPLSNLALPFWKESYTQSEMDSIQQVKDILFNSDAFVFVTPEWNGMVPAALKNLFLLYSSAEFGHKPALIASVSAGNGGAYPVNELRSSTYKNSKICYIPEHLIFQNVESIFNSNTAENKRPQAYMSDRTDFSLDYLLLYSEALKHVRAKGPVNELFTNGM